jgi:serine/threonine protein kinase
MNIYFAYQLANALQYLTQLNLIHCDLATRNCLFYSDYTIKLTDCAMALSQYEHEYWLANNGQRIPLRWMAPEVLTVRRKGFLETKFNEFLLDKSNNKI